MKPDGQTLDERFFTAHVRMFERVFADLAAAHLTQLIEALTAVLGGHDA